MKTLNPIDLINGYKAKGYELKEKYYEMNIFAVRTKDMEANTFNDFCGLFYKDEKGHWQLTYFPCTTDAGLYYRLNPINVEGTAIIVPGQHKKCYKIGKHKGYEAIEQVGNIRYIRDNNKNKFLDWIYDKAGYKYVDAINKTNIHHAGVDSIQVDKWSAGCIVFKRIKDFSTFMELLRCSVDHYKFENSFDLSLFEEKDL